MPFTDTDRRLFNVVLVTENGREGELYHHPEVVNTRPLTWDRACLWIRGIMTLIARANYPGDMDAYLEPVSIPRPWSADTLGAYNRDMAGVERELHAVYGAGVTEAAA